MKLENFDTEKAILYFEGEIGRSQSGRMHKRPFVTTSTSEKKLYDVQIAYEYFCAECAQNCYTKDAFERFLAAPDFLYILNCATAKDDYFDKIKFENSLKDCHKYLLRDIETKKVSFE